MIDPIDKSTYQWLVAWLIVIAILIAALKTRTGYVAAYYSLLLLIVLVLVTEGGQIMQTIAPLGTPVPK